MDFSKEKGGRNELKDRLSHPYLGGMGSPENYIFFGGKEGSEFQVYYVDVINVWSLTNKAKSLNGSERPFSIHFDLINIHLTSYPIHL